MNNREVKGTRKLGYEKEVGWNGGPLGVPAAGGLAYRQQGDPGAGDGGAVGGLHGVSGGRDRPSVENNWGGEG